MMLEKIYYTEVGSPWGPMFLAGTEAAISSCQFIGGNDVSSLVKQVQKKHNDAFLQENALPLASAVAELKRYFSGEQSHLSHPLDLQGSPFQIEVWSALREISPGSVVTYGEIAARIGRPGGARAVGQSCGRNPVVLFVPCHRVVAANGGLGGFGSGISVKEALLLHEGVSLK